MFLTLLKSPKVIGMVILLAAAGALYVYITSLQNENIKLASENSNLQLSLEVADGINKSNAITIAELEKDNRIKTELAKKFEDQSRAHKSTIAGLKRNISTTKPEDNGKVANVLADTIRTIQTLESSGEK